MTRGARRQGYQRRHRFSGRGCFSEILRASRKYRGALSTLHVSAGEAGSSRFGVAVARKLAPKAVERNYLKRIAREAFRRHEIRFAGANMVLTVREPFRKRGRGEWASEVAELLERALRG